jgi:hypothetical protein
MSTRRRAAVWDPGWRWSRSRHSPGVAGFRDATSVSRPVAPILLLLRPSHRTFARWGEAAGFVDDGVTPPRLRTIFVEAQWM